MVNDKMFILEAQIMGAKQIIPQRIGTQGRFTWYVHIANLWGEEICYPSPSAGNAKQENYTGERIRLLGCPWYLVSGL